MRQIKPQQLEFINWEFGIFFHFGIRTFYEGHQDWDMKEMAASGFNPTELDCENWIKTAKDAGAKYTILVCKHHDGFANWPSKYTDYSVETTPWKNGKGDVVREYVDACRKYDMKVGLYYSPAQFGSSNMQGKEYDDYFINQISELLGNYGKIDYLWFDGCGSEDHEYDTVRIVKAIRDLQPQILIFNMWDPDTRWAGNEIGAAKMPNHLLTDSTDFSILTSNKDKLDEKIFLPVECDCKIRPNNWFYSDSDADTLRSVEELMGMYYYSVGKGANLLLNIGPDRRGLIPERDAKTVIEFGEKIKELYDAKVGDMSTANRCDNTYTITLDKDHVINHVIIEEDVTNQQVERFSIKVHPYIFGQGAITVYESSTIGHKHICKFPSFRTDKIEVVIEKENAPHTLKNITIHAVK